MAARNIQLCRQVSASRNDARGFFKSAIRQCSLRYVLFVMQTLLVEAAARQLRFEGIYNFKDNTCGRVLVILQLF